MGASERRDSSQSFSSSLDGPVDDILFEKSVFEESVSSDHKIHEYKHDKSWGFHSEKNHCPALIFCSACTCVHCVWNTCNEIVFQKFTFLSLGVSCVPENMVGYCGTVW